MQELINAKIKELTENGKLDEIVTKEAINFIQNTVKNVLGSYGDVSKLFENKLKEQIMNKIETLDLVEYSKTLSDLIEAELNKSIVSIGLDPIKEMINKFTGSLEKKEWRVSEIIQKFIEEEVITNSEGNEGEIAFISEESDYGTVYISFDKDNSLKHRYQQKYRMMIDYKTKKLYSPSVDGIGIHPITEMGGLYGFDLFLFKLYAMGCTIECDIREVETGWSTHN